MKPKRESRYYQTSDAPISSVHSFYFFFKEKNKQKALGTLRVVEMVPYNSESPN